jgi:two-component system response regulator PrrA
MLDPAAPKDAPQPLVLIVDDDPAIGAVIREALELDGYTTEVVPDGRSALDRLASVAPALVILDLAMPEMTGVEVCRAIRARADGRRLPVLLLTAWLDPRERQQALAEGANDYMTKPFELGELLTRVARCLRARETEPSADA